MKRGAYTAKTERELPCRDVLIAANIHRLEKQSARVLHRRIVGRWTWKDIAHDETASVYDVRKIYAQALIDLTKLLESKVEIQYAERQPESEQFELIA